MSTSIRKHRLSQTQLTWRVPGSWTRWNTTEDLPGFRGTIGQDRAMHAIDVGLRIPARGFNLFVVGEPGAGKTSILRRLLEERAAREPVAPDLCYVANFKSPEKPRPLLLPPGRGRKLARDMERVVEELTTLVPRVLSDGSFGHLRASILGEARVKAEALNRRTVEEAARLGVRIEEDEGELRVIPLLEGEPLSQESYDKLSAARRRAIEKNILSFQEHLERNAYGKRQLERRTSDRLREAEVRAMTPMVDQLIKEVARNYRGLEDVEAFLAEVREHVLSNHRDFVADPESDDSGASGGMPGEGETGEAFVSAAARRRSVFQVNVVVDRSGERGAPVVTERLPTAENLTGYYEYRAEGGGLATDHTLIRAGALHRAHGGYLLLQASDLFSQEGAWDCLKGSLRHREVRMEGPGGASGEIRPRIAGAMKPESVDLDVKVLLVGAADYYYAVKMQDEDFDRLFKVKAEFESSMPRTKENVTRLARFLGQVCQEEGYLPLHRTGFARLLEHAARVAEHKERLSTDRALLLDVVAEANFYARQSQARAIRRGDVDLALAEHRHRHDAAAESLARAIKEGTIIIRTKGEALGQVNGIALYDLAGVSFGVPVRITARIYAGQRGVVNIDREVQLSGAIHDKGALILVGYLGGRYAQRQVLGFSASVTFEQSYDEIDGDSASAAELYALLSALSGCPLRLGVAVTGSVNQLGEIQPIGGVNEKIEGVFRICEGRGLTGEEGVLIPRANVKHLMLQGPVLDACREGKFNIWAVSTVDEGIEVMTGVPAGRRRQDGSFTPGSINDRVQLMLTKLQSVVRAGAVTTALDRPL
ncbi:MAG: ATP-binding protein [Polyangia bacterium]|jgi:lon-related putative ATP-dependent protease|nr:ATP-binding protein [Polyangia bacterium]